MPKKSSKNQVLNNMTDLQKANAELIKLFGDEETYFRYVLVNYNNKITKSFAQTRADGLYIMNEMALRNFEGGYKDFCSFHSVGRLGYAVVTNAFDYFYQFELGVFCCGALDTNEKIKKRGYYDKFNDQNSELVSTPKVIKINENHANFNVLQSLQINRDLNTPILNMDAPTMCAFTAFRTMVFEKYCHYVDYGITDATDKYGINVYYDRVKNSYVAYAIALKETAEYFKNFYSPDDVHFTSTNLPYKGLKVIEQRVENIKNKYNINTVGLLRHFDSAKKLPFINQNNDLLVTYIVKMFELKGQYIDDKDEYKRIFKKVYQSILAPEDIKYDSKGRSLGYVKSSNKTNVAVINEEFKESQKVENICNEISEQIKALSTATDEQKKYGCTRKQLMMGATIKQKLERTIPTFKVLSGVKTHLVAISTEIERQQLIEKPNQKSKQLSLFHEIKSNGKTICLQNFDDMVDSKYFKDLIDAMVKTIKSYEQLHGARVKFNNDFVELNKLDKEVKQTIQERDDYDPKDPYNRLQEHESYRYFDPDLNTHVVGSYEEYYVACAKNEFIKVNEIVVEDEHKLETLTSEVESGIKTCEKLVSSLVNEENFDIKELSDLTTIIDSIKKDEPIDVGSSEM